MKKKEKEKTLGTNNKQNKHRYHKCGRYSHKPGNHKCFENKKEHDKDRKNRKKDYIKKKYFDGICYHCGKKRHMSKDCHLRKSRKDK